MTEAEGTRHSTVTCVWDSPRGEFVVQRDPGNLEFPRYMSRLWLCWVCGTVWCRECMLDGEELQHFEVFHTPCGCQDGEYYNVVPASLTMGTRDPLDTFDTLPRELQIAEMDALLKIGKPI